MSESAGVVSLTARQIAENAGHRFTEARPDSGGGKPAAAVEPVILPAAPRYPVRSLVGPLRDFVDWAIRDGLHPEAAGAAGLAALVTLIGPARLQVTRTKIISAILWIVLVGIASSGKSPAFDHAFARIRETYAKARKRYEQELAAYDDMDAEMRKKTGPPPVRPEPFAFDDMTLEAVARWLLARRTADSDSSGAMINDELAAALQSLNQYKGGHGSDKARMLALWAGAPLHIQRVGRGGQSNEIDLFVPEPVLSVAGPLTPDNVELLGKQGSGFRPRWLLHAAPAEPPAWYDAGEHPQTWIKCIDDLIASRKPRMWFLRGAALTEWSKARERWRRQQNDAEPDDVIEALGKADQQCYRIALVIAESIDPGAGGDMPADAVKCAVAIVDYVIGCWRALPGTNTMAASRAEDVMDSAHARLLAWLDRRPKGTEGLPPGGIPRPRATRREVQQWSHLKAAKVSALIMEHELRYPGCVVSDGAREGEGKGQAGGKPTAYVYAPERTIFGVAATPNNTPIHTYPANEPPGHAVADSVLRSATPNERNTESATPNEGLPDNWPAEPPPAA